MLGGVADRRGVKLLKAKAWGQGLDRLEVVIERREARIAVVGLGYVGLPLAVEFAKAGFPVVSIDADVTKVEAIQRGECYIEDVNADEVRELVQASRLTATADWDVAAGADALIVCVPTPFNRNKEPDLSAVTSATE